MLIFKLLRESCELIEAFPLRAALRFPSVIIMLISHRLLIIKMITKEVVEYCSAFLLFQAAYDNLTDVEDFGSPSRVLNNRSGIQ